MSCVESETLIREDSHCKELLLEAMKYHLLPEQRSSMMSLRTVERRPEGMRPYIFAVGSYLIRFNFLHQFSVELIRFFVCVFVSQQVVAVCLPSIASVSVIIQEQIHGFLLRLCYGDVPDLV